MRIDRSYRTTTAGRLSYFSTGTYRVDDITLHACFANAKSMRGGLFLLSRIIADGLSARILPNRYRVFLSYYNHLHVALELVFSIVRVPVSSKPTKRRHGLLLLAFFWRQQEPERAHTGTSIICFSQESMEYRVIVRERESKG